MKKVSKFIIVLICLWMIVPIKTYAVANTLGELKQELQKLKNQKANNNASKNKTQAEINSENAKIADAHSAVEQAETDIEIAKKEIEDTNKKIEETKKETSALLVFYEIMDGEDSLLQYVSGATTMSDLIMRTDAVRQILNYSKEKLTELELLIEKNENLQVELVKKQADLEKKIITYQDSIINLKRDLSELVEVSLDIDTQIKAQQELIDFYAKAGCKDNDLLSECTKKFDTAHWYRPTEKGVVTSGYGYRTITLNGQKKSSFHGAVDIGGNSLGTKVYATAYGTVSSLVKKSSCGGNQVFIHVRVQGKAYTIQYAHLMEIKVKVGDSVTPETVIGTVGGGGATLKKNGGWDTCSTGAHLHYAVSNGFYLGGGSEGYSSWNKYIASAIQPPTLPAYGKWYYTRY